MENTQETDLLGNPIGERKLISEAKEWVSEIPEEKIQEVQFSVKGQEKCANGFVVINGLKFGTDGEGTNHGKGILGFQFINRADKKPRVIVEYHPRLITEEVLEVLGIERPPLHCNCGCVDKSKD